MFLGQTPSVAHLGVTRLAEELTALLREVRGGTYQGPSLPLRVGSRRSKHIVRVVLIPKKLAGRELLRWREWHSNLTITFVAPSRAATHLHSSGTPLTLSESNDRYHTGFPA